MKRTILALGLVLALAIPVAAEEVAFKSLSATETSQTWIFTKAASSVLICNFGANESFYRLFNENETPAAATSASAMLVAGTATAPACIEFTKGPTESAYYKAISVICSAGETATVDLISK